MSASVGRAAESLTAAFTDVIVSCVYACSPSGAMKLPSISEAESVVLTVLWRSSPLATEAVVTALAGQQHWHESTVKTLLGRLLKKGAIKAEKEGRRYVYSPVLTREQWLSSESDGLLSRLFGGRVAPLVAHFSKHRKLSKKDIADLKRLIQELDHG
jgi:BlaI family transcriptional regulator, penicillinase repressor